MSTQETNATLVKTISAAIQIPGVKVNREEFLLEAFKNESSSLRNKILEVGPVAAGCSRKQLQKLAQKYVDLRTLTSTGASFVAGIPGGIAMAATIPADTLQFFGVALRLAQEISYIYGAEDLWDNGEVDTDKVQRNLVLYCGVMFGVGGASATLRVITSAMGKQALKKIPRMALTKTFYYPIVKAIAKAVGVKMTKGVFAKGVSKAIPIMGGFFSGAITFATMRPMGMKLVDEFDEVKFDYSQDEFEADWKDLSEEFDIESDDFADIGGDAETNAPKKSFAEQLKEAKELLDAGIITEEEFKMLKDKLFSQM